MVAESHDLRRLQFFWNELKKVGWLSLARVPLFANCDSILSLSTVCQKVCYELHYVFPSFSKKMLMKIVKEIKMIII